MTMAIECHDILVSDGTDFYSMVDKKISDGTVFNNLEKSKFGVSEGNDYYVIYGGRKKNIIRVSVSAAPSETGEKIRYTFDFTYPLKSYIYIVITDLVTNKETGHLGLHPEDYGLYGKFNSVRSVTVTGGLSEGLYGHLQSVKITGLGYPDIKVGITSDQWYDYEFENPLVILLREDWPNCVLYTPFTGSNGAKELVQNYSSTEVPEQGADAVLEYGTDGVYMRNFAISYPVAIDLSQSDYTFSAFLKADDIPYRHRRGILSFPECKQAYSIYGKYDRFRLSLCWTNDNVTGEYLVNADQSTSHPLYGQEVHTFGYTYDDYNRNKSMASVPFSSPGMWHHLVGIWNAQARQFTMYIDKVLSSYASKEGVEIYTYNPVFYIGGELLASNESLTRLNNFEGKIKEVKVWNKVLSQEEITAEYVRVMTGDPNIPDNPVEYTVEVTSVQLGTGLMTDTTAGQSIPAPSGEIVVYAVRHTGPMVSGKIFFNKRITSHYIEGSYGDTFSARVTDNNSSLEFAVAANATLDDFIDVALVFEGGTRNIHVYIKSQQG